MTTASILIGNSDDKLPQRQWAAFRSLVEAKVRTACCYPGGVVQFVGDSPGGSPYQNTCWVVQLPTDPAVVDKLRDELRDLVAAFGQDSIAWAQAPKTEFLKVA